MKRFADLWPANVLQRLAEGRVVWTDVLESGVDGRIEGRCEERGSEARRERRVARWGEAEAWEAEAQLQPQPLPVPPLPPTAPSEIARRCDSPKPVMSPALIVG